MLRRLAIIFGTAGVAFVAIAAGPPVIVDQKELQFTEDAITVRRGQVVIFRNSDLSAHNIQVKGQGLSLNSSIQQPGVDFPVPFQRLGLYDISCGIHPKMQMTVTVE